MTPIARRLTLIWIAMLALTLSSFTASGSWFDDPALSIVSVIALTGVKVRLVIMEFMEVQHAPLPLRIALDAWIGTLAIGLITLMI